MISFHFTYEFKSYYARAEITVLNGEMAYELLDVLSDETNQSVSYSDFEMFKIMREKDELTDAIKSGLSKYLDNFPVGHCKSIHPL